MHMLVTPMLILTWMPLLIYHLIAKHNMQQEEGMHMCVE